MSDVSNTPPIEGNATSETLDTMTIDQFSNKLSLDKDFRSEYLKNPHDPRYDRLNAEYAQGEMGLPVPKESAPQGMRVEGKETLFEQVDSGGDTTGELSISLKIRPELLGTYLKNHKGEQVRPPQEAILEALKGIGEKDRYINTLRTQSSEYVTENQSLRGQLNAMMQSASSQGTAEPSSGSEGFNFADVEKIDDLDLFVPEEQDKLKSTVKGMAQALKQLTDVSRMQQMQQAKPDIRESAKKNLLNEITALQMDIPSLKTSVPFEVLDQEMTSFFQNVQRLSGKPLVDAWNIYHAATPEGQAFRDTCAVQNVTIPPEYGVHQTIMALKDNRDRDLDHMAAAQTNVFRASGRLKADEVLSRDMIAPAPNMSFRDYYTRLHGQESANVSPQVTQAVGNTNPALRRQIDMHREQAPQNATPTVPPGVSAPPLIDIAQMSAQEFQALMSKKDEELSIDEASALVRVYEYANQEGKAASMRTGQAFTPAPIPEGLRKRAKQAI